VWRATGGVRFTPSEHVTLKAEYLHNGEYGGIPSIPDDVFTSSLILWF
jgi:opacity protein-like surface antigen